jgi:hypothetical protein
LLITFLLWLVKSLTTDYRRELAIPVDYINLPPDVHLAVELPDTLWLSLSGTGWKFLSGNLFSQLGSLTVDLSFLSHQPAGLKAYPASHFVKRLPEFRMADVRIMRIEPDTLRFFLAENFSVKVPLIAEVSITCKNQFMISGPAKLIPDSIEIFGHESTLSGISYIAVNPVRLSKVVAPVDTLIAFTLPQGIRTGLKKLQVRLQVPVSEFAEKQFMVSVRPSSNMNGRFRFYPDQAVLTVRIPVEKYRSVLSSDFSVSAEMLSRDSKYSRLICDKLPPAAELFHLYPPFAETYIEN